MAEVEPEEEPEVRPKRDKKSKIPKNEVTVDKVVSRYLDNSGDATPPASPRWRLRIQEWQRRLPPGIGQYAAKQ